MYNSKIEAKTKTMLRPINLQPKKLNCVVLLLLIGFVLIGNEVAAATNDTTKIELTKTNETTARSVKKELKTNVEIVQITPPNEKDDHTEKLVIIDEKSITETTGKAIVQQIIPKETEKSNVLVTTTKSVTLDKHPYPQHRQGEDEDFVLVDEDDLSESLKTGFYFFLILSSAAIVFILFKIYRLRLSRAERKYGVQGDRSTQELTPLPISIEDGASDDEDQTLFEIQRQNIRIL